MVTQKSLPIPGEVIELCLALKESNHAAYVVGGAVRDLLRSAVRSEGAGKSAAKDYDVATSAPPEEVARLFGPQRTIPTGIAHGTVTVLCKTPDDSRPRHVEVTTFRGETGYSDGRRPDRVEFISDLKEDLRRRDFTINAIAYDPIGEELHDPFSGQADLTLGIIRAVGDPGQRFAEDGLRLLRAVRFAAQLEFTIEEKTRAAFLPALPTLRKVSRERIREEVVRLLAARVPSLGLVHMLEKSAVGWDATRGLLRVVLPEVATALGDSAFRATAWMELCDKVQPQRRLAAMLFPLRSFATDWSSKKLGERLDELLKLPAQQRNHLTLLIGFPEVSYDRDAPWSDADLRRFLCRHAPELIDDFLAIRIAESGAKSLLELEQRIAAERKKMPPLFTSDLAITGKDLMTELALRPGPAVGETLRRLLEIVLDAPEKNQRELLLTEARRVLAELGT